MISKTRKMLKVAWMVKEENFLLAATVKRQITLKRDVGSDQVFNVDYARSLVTSIRCVKKSKTQGQQAQVAETHQN